MRKSRKPPWKRPNPRKSAAGSARKLTPAKKSAARARAARAGRRYPNLVDNMWAARAKRRGTAKRGRKSKTRRT